MTDLSHIDKADPEAARRLIKLLAVAKRGSTEAEMNAAMALAVRHATKHRIDLATVNEDELGVTAPEEIVEGQEIVGKGHRRPPANRWIVSILQDHFHVEILYGRGKYSARVSMIGRKSDVEFAQYAYWFLHHAMQRIWRSYRRQHHASMMERADVYYGIWAGLHNRLMRERGDQERAGLLTDTAQETYALKIQTEEEARKAFIAAQHPVIIYTATKSHVVKSHRALDAGYEEGRALKIVRGLSEESPSRVNPIGDLS